MSEYYNNCALIYPYFDNPSMLEIQVDHWNRYAGELAESCRLIVVDDASEKHPADAIFGRCKWKNKSLYRVRHRIPWNQHQCRNIGAREACGPEEKGWWLFVSDIDIVLTAEMAAQMLNRKLDPNHCYSMERTFAPEFSERKTHPNTFLLRHSLYWQVNGYDLDLTGGYGGGYGGDGEFRRQISALCPLVHLDDVVLIGYGRRSRDGSPVVADADTTAAKYDRGEWSARYQEAFRRKRTRGDMRSRDPIRVRYDKVF